MTAADEYLARVSRGLAGMDRRVREDILRELRAHLADAVADGGEPAVAARLEPPEALAARYKELYGYGKPFRALFVAVAVALAVPTLPLLLFAGYGSTVAFGVALAFLAVLAAYLILVALKAGSTAGLSAGAGACVARFVTLAAFEASAGGIVPDASSLILFIGVSGVLLAIGFLPGHAKEKWKPRDVSL